MHFAFSLTTIQQKKMMAQEIRRVYLSIDGDYRRFITRSLLLSDTDKAMFWFKDRTDTKPLTPGVYFDIWKQFLTSYSITPQLDSIFCDDRYRIGFAQHISEIIDAMMEELTEPMIERLREGLEGHQRDNPFNNSGNWEQLTEGITQGFVNHFSQVVLDSGAIQAIVPVKSKRPNYGSRVRTDASNVTSNVTSDGTSNGTSNGTSHDKTIVKFNPRNYNYSSSDTVTEATEATEAIYVQSIVRTNTKFRTKDIPVGGSIVLKGDTTPRRVMVSKSYWISFEGPAILGKTGKPTNNCRINQVCKVLDEKGELLWSDV